MMSKKTKILSRATFLLSVGFSLLEIVHPMHFSGWVLLYMFGVMLLWAFTIERTFRAR